MAADANVIAGGQRYRIRTAEERRRAFASATRHTKFVTFLRKALPVFAVLVLATYFISTRLATSISIGDMNASIEGFEVKDGNLRMVNPKLEGADKKNGKYVIGADYADQDIKNPNLIKLHAIKADLAAVDGGWSRMTAVRGRFDNKTGRLVMQDKIDIATSSGVSGTLTHATLDTKKQVIRSHRPVSFVLPNGTIRANALTFYSAKHTLTFRGKVAVHMVRPKKEAETAKATPAPQNVAPQNVAPPPKAEEPGEVTLPPLPGEDGAGLGGAQGAAPSVP
jgi:lipopolysaccharide export system protein LptC